MNQFENQTLAKTARAPAVLGITLSCVVGSAWAQTSLSLQQQREATLQRIEAVTDGQFKPSDASTALGLELPRDLQERLQEPVAAPKTSTTEVTGLPTLGPVVAPRVLKRMDTPPPAANLPTPDFTRQDLTLATLVGSASIALPTPEATLGDVPADRVAKDGLDTTVFALPDLVRATLDASPDLGAAQARTNSAGLRHVKARADLLPAFAARYATGKEDSVAAAVKPENRRHDYRSSSLRLTQPLFNQPAWETWQAGAKTLEAARLRGSASEEAVALDAVKAVVALARSRVMLDFSDELIANLGDIQRYQNERAQSGAISRAEMERARTRVLAARQTRLEQVAAYKTAMLEAQRLFGFTPRQLQLPFLNQLPALPRTQAEIRDQALREQAELQALRAEVLAQERVMRSAYGRALPTVAASLEQDRSSNTGGIMGSRRDQRALLVMSWNLSLGGKEYFGGREAGADLQEVKKKLEQNELRVAQAIDTDFALLQATTLRINLGRQEQEAALKVTQAVQEQLKAGRIGSLLEALDASERLYDARSKLTEALGQQMLAQAQLLRNMGQLSAVREQAQVRFE